MAARAQPSIVTFFRLNPCKTLQNFDFQIRKLTIEAKENDLSCEETKPNQNQEHQHGYFSEIAKQVSNITRTKPRWEQTLLSGFPSFNFSDPQFFRELLKHQNNVLLSVKFFDWLRSHYNFVPDQVSCNLLFGSLLDAEASDAAKYFLDVSGFSPDVDSLERYVRCLCGGGLVQEALDVLEKFKESGVSPSIKTWNSSLLGCLNIGRTDLFWKLYHDMIQSGAVANMDVETVEYLIQAFCIDDNPWEGYKLLIQVLEDGFELRNTAFNKLIYGFCKNGDYGRVSALLHTMIAKNCLPDISTYKEVIKGLCKRRELAEALRVFNDLKDRGYFPNRVMYTTMIHGLCSIKDVDNAMKLWFEMINKGISPNGYTFAALILGFSKLGNFKQAWELYKEMCDNGYKETTLSCNIMISGLCSHGRTREAFKLFEEMPQKGILHDVFSYSYLIQGFCKESRIVEAKTLLKELLASGLQPSTYSYTSLVEKLCEMGDIQGAKELWDNMLKRGLEPLAYAYDHLITTFFTQGHLKEGMNLLVATQERELKLQKATFERSVECLSQENRLADSLLVLKFMFRIGYVLEKGTCHSLVSKLCKRNSLFTQTCLDKVVERN